MKTPNGYSLSKKIAAIVIICLLSGALNAQPKPDAFVGWDNYKTEVPAWLQDAKFGIYFHWGVYTVPAFNSEWYSRSMYVPDTGPYKHQQALHGSLKNFGYKDFIPLFKAEHFNAEEWADIFVKAGAKFAGPVAEHADGFSMWNSRVNPWNAAQMGPQTDVVGEMEKAIRKRKLKFFTSFHHQWQWGWYPTFDTTSDVGNPAFASLYGPKVSMAAWQHKDSAEKPNAAFSDTWLAKVKEVVKNYQPDLLYFDSRLGHIGDAYRKEVLSTFYGQAKGDKIILYKAFDLPVNAGMRVYEKSRVNRLSEKPWLTEEPITTYSWSYTSDMELRQARDILNVMIDIISKNGVYLLNIAPKADGTIPLEQKEILFAIGDWLQQNGEAFYGTRPWYTYGEGPRKEADEKGGTTRNRQEYFKLKYTADDIRYTTKGDMINAIFLGRPEAGKKVLLKAFQKDSLDNSLEITGVSVPGADEKVIWNWQRDGLMITVPDGLAGDMATVFRIKTSRKK